MPAPKRLSKETIRDGTAPAHLLQWTEPSAELLTFLEKRREIADSILLGMVKPGEPLPHYDIKPTFDWFAPLFGPDTPTHAFSHRPTLFGFSTREPHLTRTLAAFMQPENVGWKMARKRAGTFLRALDLATEGKLTPCGELEPRMSDCLPDGDLSVLVIAELQENAPHRKANGNRIDLYFEWEKERKYSLGIEVKFGTLPLRKNQLTDYNSILKSYKKPYFRVVATTNSVDSPDLLDGWHNLLWSRFIRAWESEIQASEDDDESFAQFRRAFWISALGG